MIDCNDRNVASNQLHNIGIIEIHAGNAHSVKAAISRMRKIGHPVASCGIAVNEGQIVAEGFRVTLEAVQKSCIIVMRQSALRLVHKENSKVIGSIGFQRLCRGVGHVTKIHRSLANTFLGFFTDVVMIVKCLAYGSNRHPAGR